METDYKYMTFWAAIGFIVFFSVGWLILHENGNARQERTRERAECQRLENEAAVALCLHGVGR